MWGEEVRDLKEKKQKQTNKTLACWAFPAVIFAQQVRERMEAARGERRASGLPQEAAEAASNLSCSDPSPRCRCTHDSPTSGVVAGGGYRKDQRAGRVTRRRRGVRMRCSPGCRSDSGEPAPGPPNGVLIHCTAVTVEPRDSRVRRACLTEGTGQWQTCNPLMAARLWCLTPASPDWAHQPVGPASWGS